MKLFYTPVERMLLSIDNRCAVATSDVLWDTAKAVFDKYRSKQKRIEALRTIDLAEREAAYRAEIEAMYRAEIEAIDLAEIVALDAI